MNLMVTNSLRHPSAPVVRESLSTFLPHISSFDLHCFHQQKKKHTKIVSGFCAVGVTSEESAGEM